MKELCWFLAGVLMFAAGYFVGSRGEKSPAVPNTIERDTSFVSKPYTPPKDSIVYIKGKTKTVYDSTAILEAVQQKIRADSLQAIVNWLAPFDFQGETPKYIVSGTVDPLRTAVENLVVEAKPIIVDSVQTITEKKYVPVPPTFGEKLEYAAYGGGTVALVLLIAVIAL
jgi:hypothetical protein